MPGTGGTAIGLFYSTTPGVVATAGEIATNGELFINTADGKLFYKDSGGVVQTLAAKSPVGQTVTAILEPLGVVASPATGTINFDALTQNVLWYSSNATGVWVLNVRGNSTTTLNSVMATNQTLSIAFQAPLGATPYAMSSMTIDGSAVTVNWPNGVVPTGNASALNVYTFAIEKTASATYTVLGSMTAYS